MPNRPLALLLLCLFAPTLRAAEPEQIDVFTRGQGGYHTYRIPAIAVTPKGTVLAFAEGRKKGQGDAGDIDVVLRRSTDGGKTFGDTQVVWDDADNTCGNPCPIVDPQSGAIVLLLTHNLGADHERDIVARKSKGTRTVWLTRSDDDGATWAKPVEITGDAKRPEWTWYATGPGNGIVTRAGRMVAPCDHMLPGAANAHVIYSDDRGKTWKLGGTAGPTTNESRVVELSDGRLLLNMRNHGSKKKTRAISTSTDGGVTWSPVAYDETLIEPVCQATLIRADDPKTKEPRFLFANPASSKREKMTIRLSTDDCKTWPKHKELWPGPAAYSDVAVLPDDTALCLYERGDKGAYERITVARFPMSWLVE